MTRTHLAKAGEAFRRLDRISRERALTHRESLHGTLHEDSFPIEARFPSGLPDEIDDALLAVSHDETPPIQGASNE